MLPLGIVAALLAATILALVATPAAAVTTYTGFVLDSEPGMTFGGGQLFDQDPGAVTGVMASINGNTAEATLTSGEWTFRFRAGAPSFAVGTYFDGGSPDLRVTRDGIQCGSPSWRYRVLEVPETSGSSITRFSADFYTRCGTQQRFMHGSIRLGSSIPTSLLRIDGPITLPDTIVGAVSAPSVFTVSNVGGSDVALTGGSMGGTNPDQFQVVDGCGTVSLDPGQSCELQVRFAPTSTTTKSATWTVPNSTWEPGRIARLTGIGRSPLTLLPSSLAWYSRGGSAPAGYSATSPATFSTAGSTATAVHLESGPWSLRFNDGGSAITAKTYADLGPINLAVAYNRQDCDGPGSITVLDPPVVDTDGAFLQFAADVTFACGGKPLDLWIRFHADRPYPPAPNPSIAPTLNRSEARMGDTITIDPHLSGSAMLERVRCRMWIEGDEGGPNWVRMAVASDDCAPWTFTLPPSPLGTYVVHAWLHYEDSGFGQGSVSGGTRALDVLAGGTATTFSTNYPVASWAIEELLSDATPSYGAPLTVRSPEAAADCQLSVFAGYEAAWTTQYDGCADWTFTIPAPSGNAVVPFFISRADATVTAWTGTSTWDDDRVDAGFLGARWGSTYRGTIPDFAGEGGGSYASNRPAVFSNDLRNRVHYVDEPGPYAYTPIVVSGPAGGSCIDNQGAVHAVSAGSCGSFQVPDWTATNNGSATAQVLLRDAAGRTIAGTAADVGFAQRLALLSLVAPDVVELGTTPDITVATTAGLPAEWSVVVSPAGSSLAAGDAQAVLGGAVGEHSGSFTVEIGRSGNAVTLEDLLLPVGTYDLRATFTDVRGATVSTSDRIVVQDAKGPSGTVVVSGGASYTRSAGVIVSTPAQDPSGVSHVALSNDGATWTTRTYGPAQAWTLPSTNGTRTVWVKWRDSLGHWSAPKTDTIVLDTVRPLAGSVAASFRSGGTVSGTALPFRVSWTGTDPTSGVARYELAQRIGDGAWVTISSSITSTSANRGLVPGASYQFRVRPVDRAGNVGEWAYGRTSRVSAVQQTSSRIAWSGTWRTVSSSSYWGGSTRHASAAGAQARFSVTGRSFAWIAATGPTRGSARIYVNGTLVKTVSLYSSTTTTKRVAFVKTWSTAATRTITIRVVGTAGHPRVDLDGIAWGS